jgi:hypothetical protein
MITNQVIRSIPKEGKPVRRLAAEVFIAGAQDQPPNPPRNVLSCIAGMEFPVPEFGENTVMKATLFFAVSLALLSIAVASAAPAVPPYAVESKPGGIVGCGISTGAQGSGCPNVLGFKTHKECMENRMEHGWRTNESAGYWLAWG